MLKPTDPPIGPGSDEERPVSDLVHQLVEDVKAYAHAELDLAKAMAAAKASAVKVPAILLGAAFLFLQAAVAVLAMGVFVALAPRFGPILAALLAFLMFAGIAGGVAWLAVKKLREAM